MINFQNDKISFQVTKNYETIVNNKKVEKLPKIPATHANKIIEVIAKEIDSPIKVDNLKDFFKQINEKFLLYHLSVDLKRLNCSRYTMSKGSSTLDKLKERLHRKVSEVQYKAEKFIKKDFTSQLYLEILNEVGGVVYSSSLSSWDYSDYYKKNKEIKSIYDNFNNYDISLLPISKEILKNKNEEFKKEVERYQSDLDYALKLIKSEGKELVNWSQHKISRRLNKETEISSTHFVDSILNDEIDKLKKKGIKVTPKKVNKTKQDILSKEYSEMTQKELVYALKNTNDALNIVDLMNDDTLVGLLESKLKVVQNKLYNIDRWKRASDSRVFIKIANLISSSKKNYNLVLEIAKKYAIKLEIDFFEKQGKYVDKKIMEISKDEYGRDGSVYLNRIKTSDDAGIQNLDLITNLKSLLKSVNDITSIKIPFRNLILEDMTKEEILSQYSKLKSDDYFHGISELVNKTNYSLVFSKVSFKELKEFIVINSDAKLISSDNSLIESFLEIASKEMILDYIKDNVRYYHCDVKKFFKVENHKIMIKKMGDNKLVDLINCLNDYETIEFLNTIKLDKEKCSFILKNIEFNHYIARRLYKIDSKMFMEVLNSVDVSLDEIPLAYLSNEDRLVLINKNYFAFSGKKESFQNLFKGITREELIKTDFFRLDSIKDVMYHNYEIIVKYAPHVLSKKEIEILISNEDYQFLIKNVNIVDDKILKKYLGDKKDNEIKESVLNAFNANKKVVYSSYGRRVNNKLDLRNTNVRNVYNQIIGKVA